MSGSLSEPKVAAVVLAAGGSQRMTGIKQNLPWKHTTLLGHTIGQLKGAVSKIYVVLGAEIEQIKAHNDLSEVELITNDNWKRGMGVSIGMAMGHIIKSAKDYDGFLIATCDQPMVEVNHYKKLINSCIDYNRIVASYYNNRVGIPVVFGKKYRDQLLHLHGDTGAKSIIKNNLAHLVKLDAPEAIYDLDTFQEYQKFYNTHGRPV